MFKVEEDEVSDLPCAQVVESLDNPKNGRRGEVEFSPSQLNEYEKTLHYAGVQGLSDLIATRGSQVTNLIPVFC